MKHCGMQMMNFGDDAIPNCQSERTNGKRNSLAVSGIVSSQFCRLKTPLSIN